MVGYIPDGLLVSRQSPIQVVTGSDVEQLRKFCYSSKDRTLWNSLSDIVVKAESVNSFKFPWTDSGMIGELNLA